MNYNLAISYTWIYDIEFTQLIEHLFQKEGFSTYIINESNIEEVTWLVREKKLFFDVYLDRASDVDEKFNELATLLTNSSCRIINPYDKTDTAIDKSRIQDKLIAKGLRIPKTIIIPPLDSHPELKISEENLEQIGKPFVIKPAYYSGGSEGVNKNAYLFEDIENCRKENSDDNYLVQEKIYPALIKNHRTWFRVLWVFGKIIPMLWDDEALLYSEEETQNLFPEVVPEIEEDIIKIYEVTELDYFSSEFAFNNNNELYLIDYVNDQCDMRLKSNHPDGVPDKIVNQFIYELLRFVKNVDRPQ